MTAAKKRTDAERHALAAASALLLATGYTQRAAAKMLHISLRDLQRYLAEYPAEEPAARITKKLDDGDQQRLAEASRARAEVAADVVKEKP